MYLNIGDPVAFDFKTPFHIKHALVDALAEIMIIILILRAGMN